MDLPSKQIQYRVLGTDGFWTFSDLEQSQGISPFEVDRAEFVNVYPAL